MPESTNTANVPVSVLADGTVTANEHAIGTITPNALADDNGIPTGAESATEPFIPVAERSVEEQVAYWRAEAKKQTKINRERQDYEDVKAKADQFDALHQEQQTEHEKALAAARDEAARQARIESLPLLISAELRARNVPAEVANAQIELLDLTKFVTETGDLDATRLDAIAKPIVAPSHSALQDFGRVGSAGRGAGEPLSAMIARRAAEMSTK